MGTVEQLLQGMLPLLLPCDLSTRTSLRLQHEPYSAIFSLVSTSPRCCWFSRDETAMLVYKTMANFA